MNEHVISNKFEVDVRDNRMGSRERTLVKIIVGHESMVLDKPTIEGHTFRWTLFVRAVAPAKLVDRSLISKVTFHLHESYTNHTRILREPPFDVSETGYASFSPSISIQFNYPGAKPIKYTYDMNIVLDKHGFSQQEVTLELKDVPPPFMEIVRRYSNMEKKRKRESLEKDLQNTKKHKAEEDRGIRDSQKSSKDKSKEKHRDESSRKEKKKEKRDKITPVRDNVKDSSKSGVKEKEVSSNSDAVFSSPALPTARTLPPPSTTPLRPLPLKMAPNKSEDRKKVPDSDYSSPSSVGSCSSSASPARAMSLVEMKRRIAALTDEDHIFRVASILLAHQSSMLFPSKGSLIFDLDLTTADNSLIQQLSQALTS